MNRSLFFQWAVGLAALLTAACSSTGVKVQQSNQLYEMVSPVQKSVVTVAAADMDGDVYSLGTGFFIENDGILVTNYHVLEGAYKAEIKTADGHKYPIVSVIARNKLVDLIKVRVRIPHEQVFPVILAEVEPALADRVVVIGSPMGLEQTISEGIISAVRKFSANGNIFQLTAPISEGSSGGPVLNLKGEVIGVVSFQAARGQNLNFAVSVKTLQMLPLEKGEPSLAEWTLEKSGANPRLAAYLCQQGAQLSIKGKYEAALDYFMKATEANPDDPDAWSGLGSCYIGLNRPEPALEAFHQSVNVAPENAAGLFNLAMYYKTLEQYQQEIPLLLRVIGIDPENLQARFELAEAYKKLERTVEEIETLKGILALEPEHVPTLHRMGQTMGRIGRYDEALDLLRRASLLAPENARIHFDMGVVYNSKNLTEEELRAYNRAIRADPRMAPAHYNLALLFLGQGNRKLALQEYAIIKNLDAGAAERLFEKIYPENINQITSPEFMGP